MLRTENQRIGAWSVDVGGEPESRFEFGRFSGGRESGGDGSAELGGELGDGLLVRGKLSEVGELFWIGVVVVEFAPFFSFVPFGISPARRSQAVPEELFAVGTDVPAIGASGVSAAALDLGDGPASSEVGWVLEHGDEALAMNIVWCLDAAQFGEGWEQVDMGDGRGSDGGFGVFWGDDEHGNPSAFLEETHLLPEAVFAGVVAVITGENDDGVVGETESV